MDAPGERARSLCFEKPEVCDRVVVASMPVPVVVDTAGKLLLMSLPRAYGAAAAAFRGGQPPRRSRTGSGEGFSTAGNGRPGAAIEYIGSGVTYGRKPERSGFT